MKPILEVKNLWKQYKIGGQQASYLSLREKLLQPFQRQKSDTFWALQDINFDVYEGECIGIIGKNGAGKSTLLKILSQITPPTKGYIKARGRIASLLEVGTGFHPELTGRENVYLNGSILGLKRTEINAKFDEIIDFSGIEKFLDTPLKHYSSGMRLRLAFSVAAHLEPEILLIDEVLAVGDAEFQKKCLGKMDEVSKSGRTVIFVSHNLTAVKQLCDRGIYLQNGQIHSVGSIDEILNEYMNTNELQGNEGEIKWDLENAPGEELKLLEVNLSDDSGVIKSNFTSDETITLTVKYYITKNLNNMRFNFSLLTNDELCIFFSSTHKQEPPEKPLGHYIAQVKIPSNLLNDGTYKIQLQAGCPYIKEILKKITCLQFNIVRINNKSTDVEKKLPGLIAPILNWEIKNND